MRRPSSALAFDALGDPTRRHVFELLAGGRQSVASLAARLPVSRPAVSQHLRVLKDAGLVTAAVEGRHRYYRVRAQGLEVVRSWLDSFWDEALASFQREAEREAARTAAKKERK